MRIGYFLKPHYLLRDMCLPTGTLMELILTFVPKWFIVNSENGTV